MTNIFIPLQPQAPAIQTSARYSSRRELTPLIDRPAPFMWRQLFHRTCSGSPDFDWMPAGFVRCGPGDIARVVARLADITHSTNEAFTVHLQEAEPEERERLMMEGINLFGESGGAYGIPAV